MINKIGVFTAALAMAVMTGCVSKTQYVELENQLNDTQGQLETETRQHNDLQSRFDRLQDLNRQHLDRIDALEGERDMLSNANAQLQLEVNQKNEVLEEKEEVISHLEETRRDIEASLREQIQQKDIKIEEMAGKLKVTFVDKILFDSGSVQIKAKGKEALMRLADVFRDKSDQTIVVEGHTDDVKIGAVLQQKFPSNWELSTARAAAVVRFLETDAAIAPERLTASGYGYHRPVASNEDEAGRSQNRRIEVILVPRP